MAAYHESKVELLAGNVDGVNKDFTTPTAYVAGSLRVIKNGVWYAASDADNGWTEVGDTSVTLNTAPTGGAMPDVVQAFYLEKNASDTLDLSDVKGSPFDPTGSLP